MSAMTAEQALFLLQDVYLATLKNESRITKKILEAVPADKCEHKPDPISKSAIELVRHIAAADNRFLEAVINDVLNVDPNMIPENVKTPQEIADWYEARYAKNFEALTKASGEQLVKMVDFRGMFQRPAVTFLMMGL
ncbi:MAG TPA: DinB family protein, partial [Candidatus Bathyarchaeia archaeon]|nr:DinB family protein [Candidatus Bathyarchaeia archaeon]